MQPKEIRITGVFKDNITPQIKRINKQIRLLQMNTMALSGGRAKRRTFAFFGEAANEMGKMKAALDGSTDSLKEYRKQALLVARANARLARANARAASVRTPRSEGGGRRNVPPAARVPDGGGASMMTMAGASAIGNVVASTITGAFSKGADLVRQALMTVMGGFQERIGDQLSDIQSAGGIFALAQRKGLKDFGSSFDEALQFQKTLNAELARAAGALPGSTAQYVQTSKGLTDGLMTTIGKDGANFKKAFGEGSTDMRDAMQNALVQLTTKGTMIGMGQQGGIPLPVLLERILSQEKVNVQSMANTFAALEQNPLLKNALEEAQDAINASGANTADRLSVLLGALDNALPAEQINAMKRSTSGLLEAFNSFFMDPESGLFGLGRTLNFQIAEFSSSTGEMTGGRSASGLFDMLNDIFSNIALVISEMLPVLSDIFDPLSSIGQLFVDLREQSFGLFSLFNKSTRYFQSVASKFNIDPDTFQVGIRSSLMAMLMWLENVGVIVDGAQGIKNTLKNSKELTKQFKGDTLKKLMSSFISSDFMVNLGESIGKAIAMIIVNIDQAVGGITSAAGGAANPLGAAFAGFRDAGGGAAFRNIVTTIIGTVFNFAKDQLLLLMKDNPLGSIIAGGTAFIAMNPGIVAELGSTILERVQEPLMTLGGNLFTKLAALIGGPAVWISLGVILTAIIAKTMGGAIKNFFGNMAERFTAWADTQTGIWGFFMRRIADTFQSVIKVITGVLDFLKGIVDFLIGILTGDWEKAREALKESLGGFTDIFIGAVETIFDTILYPIKFIGKKMGILKGEVERDSVSSMKNFRNSSSSLSRSVFGSSGGGGASGGSGGGGVAGSISNMLGKAFGFEGGVSAKATKSVASTSGASINIPDAALAGQGSMNLTTMLPLMESLGQKFEPGRATAGKTQGIQQLWSGKHSKNSKHYSYRGIDIGDATTSPLTLSKMFWWLKNNFGASSEGGQLEELYYDPIGSMISEGVFKKGSIGGHGHHLHIGWKSGADLPPGILQAGESAYMGHTSPLIEEARNMPAGSRLAVANTSEAVMTPEQVKAMFAGIASGTGGGGIHIGNLNVGSGSAQEIAHEVLNEIEKAVSQSKIASAYM